MSSLITDEAMDLLWAISTGQMAEAAAKKYPAMAASLKPGHAPSGQDKYGQSQVSASFGEPQISRGLGVNFGEPEIQRGEGFDEPGRNVELDPIHLSIGQAKKIGGQHGQKTKAQEDDWWVSHMSNTDYDPKASKDELSPSGNMQPQSIKPGQWNAGARDQIDETGKSRNQVG